MYLTGGQFKGHKIESSKNARPTLSKNRESIFNILIQFESKETFLDMFAGSAIMGLEALSRGYKVKELEINPKCAQIIKKNYEKLHLKPDLTICNSLNYKGEKFDIVYLDPPWEMDYEPIIKKAIELTNQNGLIIVEHDSKTDISAIIAKENLNILKSKKYGRCCIDFISIL